jgi:hypothetical protein
MRYGDKDGFKDIYDDKGELILHPNERILVTEENVVPSIKSTWRYYGGDYLLEPSKGTIFLTNERFIFINIPERMFAIGGDEARAMSAPMESSFELGDISTGAAVREYFEISNIEIMGSEKKEGAVSVGVMVNVYILSSGNQYHLSMVLTKDSDLLMRLMNKEVKTLDELVNNLKDFFRRTDWMFMEGEKKLYNSNEEVEETPVIEETVPPPSNDSKRPNQTYRSNISPPAQPLKPVKMNRTVPLTNDVSNKSMEYFENLYRKGLIKEEIYQKLLTQYRMSNPVPIEPVNIAPIEEPEIPIASATPVEASTEPEVEQPPSEPETPVEEPKAADPDDDLLNMLNDTLTDLGGEEAPHPEEPKGEKQVPVNKPRPIRAKKVHKTS